MLRVRPIFTPEQGSFNLLKAAMKKQSPLLGGKRSPRRLATISEDEEETILQKTLLRPERSREESTELKESNEECRDCKNKSETEHHELLIRHINTPLDDRRTLTEPRPKASKPVFQTAHSKDLNVAKVLFPDFFPRQLEQDNCEGGLWAAKQTMEEIFSGRNRGVDVSEKFGLHHDANFEYWKRYQLSFS